MKKDLHLIIIFSFLFFSTTIQAQNDRVKIIQKQVIPTTSATNNNVVENNKSAAPTKETKRVANPATNSQKLDAAQKTEIQVPAKEAKDLRKPKVIALEEVVESTDNNKQAILEPINPESNVTYTKVDESAERKGNVITSERAPTKTQKSVNYQPKVVKEDIHPITDYSNTSTPPNKKVYLQQEADDLQLEINQNLNNPSYDLIVKQKQLNDIKKLIQQ